MACTESGFGSLTMPVREDKAFLIGLAVLRAVLHLLLGDPVDQ
jgi:hypothetical protein